LTPKPAWLKAFQGGLMKTPWVTLGLALANCLLAISLRMHADTKAAITPRVVEADSASKTQTLHRVKATRSQPQPETPFAAIYSADSRQFVANLRSIGCPEQTIKDILSAEINRRYAAQEETLRPKPADHVPYGWSAKTSEGKLIARRQEAAAIAREKQAQLRAALGYEVDVKMPQYAMTTSDQIFDRFLDSLPSEKRPAAQAVQEAYWAGVQMLRDRTRGFWQAEDIAALGELKAKRKEALTSLAPPR
jgi:hypothetical protein